MWRNGNDVDVFSSVSLNLIDFIDETAVVNVFHVGSELKDGYFLDDRNVEQTIVWDGIGHGHHTASVEAPVTDGKVEDSVVEYKFIIDGELDMGDFVCQYTLHQTNQITNGASFALLFHQVGGVAHHLVESGSGGIEEITDACVAVIIVGQFADVVRVYVSRLDDFGHFVVFQRNIKSAAPVVARTSMACRGYSVSTSSNSIPSLISVCLIKGQSFPDFPTEAFGLTTTNHLLFSSVIQHQIWGQR